MIFIISRRATMTAVTIPSVRTIGLHIHISLHITAPTLRARRVAKSIELISRMRRIGRPIAWYNIVSLVRTCRAGQECRRVAS
jgi:diaminopimelate decarboxylase